MCVQHCAQKEPLSRGVELRGIGTTRCFGILARALIDGRLTMDRWPKTAVDRIKDDRQCSYFLRHQISTK